MYAVLVHCEGGLSINQLINFSSDKAVGLGGSV